MSCLFCKTNTSYYCEKVYDEYENKNTVIWICERCLRHWVMWETENKEYNI